MQKIKKALKWLLVLILGLVAILLSAYIVYDQFYYRRELHAIEARLQQIPGVEVLAMWGNEDVTLEEISARLRIKGKGEIELYDLSSEATSYPSLVRVHEISGYTFTRFDCNVQKVGGSVLGIGPGINIGTSDTLGRMIGVEFKRVEDVVRNYDRILAVVKSLKQAPELNHFLTPDCEQYLLIEQGKTTDHDPVSAALSNAGNAFDFAKTLKWRDSSCTKY